MDTILDTPLLNNDQCNICLLDMLDNPSDLQYGLCKCNGIFHQSCWTKWINENKHCPICRRSHLKKENANKSEETRDTEFEDNEDNENNENYEDIQITIRIPNVVRNIYQYSGHTCVITIYSYFAYLFHGCIYLAICFACGLGLVCLNHSEGCTQFPNSDSKEFIYHILYLILIGFIGIMVIILILNKCCTVTI